MSAKKIQILGNIGSVSGDADTLDGLHASEFATVTEMEELRSELSEINIDEIREVVSVVLEEFSGDEVRY